jgi:hypothetical protein
MDNISVCRNGHLKRKEPLQSAANGVYVYHNSNLSDPALLPQNDSGEPFLNDFVGDEAVPFTYMRPYPREDLTDKRLAVN